MSPDLIVWYVAFVLSTTVHEAAHALAAYLGGDPTAYQAGQVSLNPIPHMRREPFGMIAVPLLGLFSGGWCVGWASTPYDPAWEERHPRRAAWMAAAGPGANLALALFALLILQTGLGVGTFAAPEQVSFSRYVEAATPFADNVGRFFSMLLTLNVILMLFNLIPFPPLDGAAAMMLLVSEDLGLRLRTVMAQPGFAIAGLLAAWIGFGYVIGPVFSLLITLVHGPGLYGSS